MAELLTLLRLLAPALLAGLFDRSRGRAIGRASLLAGLGVALPACADLVQAVFTGASGAARDGLLARAWAAEAIAALLAVAMPGLVRLAWELRGRARVAALTRERARLVAEWSVDA